MINKKKLHFYQLTFIFGAITILTLLYNWGYGSNSESNASMMSQSMGNMMASMHIQNIKLSDLFKAEDISEISKGSTSQQQEERSFKKDLYYLSTITIVILLPFIIAGSVFLAVVWIK